MQSSVCVYGVFDFVEFRWPRDLCRTLLATVSAYRFSRYVKLFNTRETWCFIFDRGRKTFSTNFRGVHVVNQLLYGAAAPQSRVPFLQIENSVDDNLISYDELSDSFSTS